MSDGLVIVIALMGIFFGAAILLAIVVFGTQSRNIKNKREHELALERIELEKECVEQGNYHDSLPILWWFGSPDFSLMSELRCKESDIEF